MNAGMIQQLLAFRNPQEPCALLKGLGAQLGHLFQLGSGGKGAVFLPKGHNIFGSGRGQAGNLLQQAPGGGVHIHAHGIDAVLHHGAQGGIQLLLGAVMLVLAHADGLGVDFYQLGQGVLKTAGNGNGRAQIHIILRKFLRSQGRGRIYGSAGLVYDHITGLGEGTQQLHGHGFRLPGGGAVSDGNVPDLMLAHEPGKHGNGLLFLSFTEGGVDHAGIQHLAGGIHHGYLAAIAVAGVQAHGYKALHRGLHQQGLQVQREIMDGALACPVSEGIADLPLDGGENQPVKGILGGSFDKLRYLHGGL